MTTSLAHNRLAERTAALRRDGRTGLAPFVTAGDGGLDTTLAVLLALERAGATCVELGMPFSDPIADGPVLQAAAQRALAAGTRLEGVLELVARLRAHGSELPLALMSYANPLVRRGWERSCAALAGAGVDALLVPDLPLEESGQMRHAALAHGLCPIAFVAPTSDPARVAAAAAHSRGFLYVIGRTGVTGRATSVDRELAEFLGVVRGEAGSLPLALGFGLRDAEQVRSVRGLADLAIVGSALVERLHRAGPQGAARAAEDYLGKLARGLEP